MFVLNTSASTFIEQLHKSWKVSVRLAPFKIYNCNHKYVCVLVCTHRRPCRRPPPPASHKFIHTQLWSFPFYAKSLALLKLFYLGELCSAGLCSSVGVGGGGGGGSAVPYSCIPSERARALSDKGMKEIDSFCNAAAAFSINAWNNARCRFSSLHESM